MITAETIQDFTKIRESWGGQSVGFVPTMGALHAGHAKLIQTARTECDKVVLSIFVNPTQFNDASDLQKYPRTLEADLQMARECGADAVWLPNYTQLYPDDYRYKLSESDFSRKFEGAHRPGHFDGVLTVVLKLLNVARPRRAYFGEKDFQQLMLIQGMVQSLFLPITIVPVATVREPSGLAMSSRNRRLTPQELEIAPRLHAILREAGSPGEAAKELARVGFRVDYVEDFAGRRLAAAFLGEVRLIDNVLIGEQENG